MIFHPVWESGYHAFDRNLGSFLYDAPEKAASNEKVRLHLEKAFAQASFNQVINPEEVAEVIIQH